MSEEKALRIPKEESEAMALFQTTYGKDLSKLELVLFWNHAKSVGLDPLKRQIYAVKRGGRVTHQTGIDGFRAIAARSGDHAGTDEIEFSYDDKENVKEAKCTVWKMVKGNRVAFVGKAKWDEFYPGDKMGHMWKKMPETMLGKCAEAQALRKAFPEDLGQVYVDEEMQQAEVKDVTPNKEASDFEKRIEQTPARDVPEYGETIEEELEEL